MSRSHLRRLAALERIANPHGYDKVHSFTVQEGEDVDAYVAALCASGEAKESDFFIARIIVSPPQRENA